jgi:hypothetical protein
LHTAPLIASVRTLAECTVRESALCTVQIERDPANAGIAIVAHADSVWRVRFRRAKNATARECTGVVLTKVVIAQITCLALGRGIAEGLVAGPRIAYIVRTLGGQSWRRSRIERVHLTLCVVESVHTDSEKALVSTGAILSGKRCRIAGVRGGIRVAEVGATLIGRRVDRRTLDKRVKTLSASRVTEILCACIVVCTLQRNVGTATASIGETAAHLTVEQRTVG